MTNIHIGEEIFGYKIIKEIASGGEGDVYLAKRGRELKAVKFINEALGSPKIINGIEEQINKLEEIKEDCPNMVLPDCLIKEKRAIIMRYIEGKDLSEILNQENVKNNAGSGTIWIQKNSLPIDRALDVIYQLTNALEVLHKYETVHRDLRPRNIRITPEGRVVLLDYTQVKTLDKVFSNDPYRSPTGRIGDPHYQQQEILLRERDYEKRDDLWALGAVLYEILAKRRIHKDFSDSHPSNLDSIKELEKIPQEIKTFLIKTLSRVDKSYQSAAEMKRDLEKLMKKPSNVRIKIQELYGTNKPIDLENFIKISTLEGLLSGEEKKELEKSSKDYSNKLSTEIKSYVNQLTKEQTIPREKIVDIAVCMYIGEKLGLTNEKKALENLIKKSDELKETNLRTNLQKEFDQKTQNLKILVEQKINDIRREAEQEYNKKTQNLRAEIEQEIRGKEVYARKKIIEQNINTRIQEYQNILSPSNGLIDVNSLKKAVMLRDAIPKIAEIIGLDSINDIKRRIDDQFSKRRESDKRLITSKLVDLKRRSSNKGISDTERKQITQETLRLNILTNLYQIEDIRIDVPE